MPLVRIDIRKGKDGDYRQAIGHAVYDALVSVGVPENDRFQVVGEHEDIVITLVDVKKDNSSFGNGVAQYAP